MSDPYEFDVALSFAGEDREFVEDVATELKAAHVKYFLDSDYLAEMWGEDLVEFFDGVYRKRSRYAVLFLSRHYAEKVWPRQERRSALARALEERSAYVLPIRLDDTEIDGLRPTVAYLDARRMGIDGIVRTLISKLAGAPGGPDAWPGNRAPRTSRELAQVLAQRPPGWEYLYFAGCLRVGLDALAPKYRDHEVSHPTAATWVTMEGAPDFMQGAIGEIRRIVGSLTNLFDPANQERAFGAPGQAGDPERIEHLAARMTSAYEGLMQWASRIRGVTRPAELDDLFDNLARFADQPIREYRAFVDEIVTQFDRIPGAIAAHEPLVMKRNADSQPRRRRQGSVVSRTTARVRLEGHFARRLGRATPSARRSPTERLPVSTAMPGAGRAPRGPTRARQLEARDLRVQIHLPRPHLEPRAVLSTASNGRRCDHSAYKAECRPSQVRFQPAHR